MKKKIQNTINTFHNKNNKPLVRKNVRDSGVLRLKLQYFGHLMRRTDSLEKTLMLGKIVGMKRRG